MCLASSPAVLLCCTRRIIVPIGQVGGCHIPPPLWGQGPLHVPGLGPPPGGGAHQTEAVPQHHLDRVLPDHLPPSDQAQLSARHPRHQHGQLLVSLLNVLNIKNPCHRDPPGASVILLDPGKPKFDNSTVSKIIHFLFRKTTSHLVSQGFHSTFG